MSVTIQPVILSGGSGSRLWPMSRALFPKQLLPLVTEQTLLQDTVTRIDGLDKLNNDLQLGKPVVVCNEEHRFFVAEQLLQLGINSAEIFLEPVGRNTAPALTIAALSAREKDPQTILLVMPADHVITDVAAFHRAVLAGMEQALAGRLVTFGITPTHAETGYGYIKKGAVLNNNTVEAAEISAFVEKPDAATAQSYLLSGDYLWNSGMFMMTAASWLSALKTFNAEMLECVERAWKAGEQDRDFYRVDEAIFSDCPSDSIDYAVMEKVTTSNPNSDRQFSAAVIPLDAGWSDVGAWSSLWDVGNKDDEGNVKRGDVYTSDVKNSLIFADKRHISGIGLDNMVIVETADAILVADKSRAQDVKHAVDWLKKEDREEHLNHRRVNRPWGCYEQIDAGDRYQVKRITVKPGAALSLQMHHHRAEHWIVVKGTAKVTRGEETFLVSENQSTFIPLGTKHRLENQGAIPLEMIEVQSGSYLGEDDIVRFDDVYGRKDKMN
ncbi:mannose-1-phosphate guanylyltransferase/mannose-6-phosphate isomerase [Kaarinaea lacus]